MVEHTDYWKCPKCGEAHEIDSNKVEIENVCHICGFKGTGKVIPSTIASGGFTSIGEGRLVFVDKWTDGGLFLDPRTTNGGRCGVYARTHSQTTQNGYPIVCCPISKKPIALARKYATSCSPYSECHHVIYEGEMSEKTIEWFWGPQTVHIHPDVHDEIHFGKRLREINTSDVKESITEFGRTQAHTVATRFDEIDAWDDDKAMKIRDLLWVNQLCVLWKYMSDEHRFHPHTSYRERPSIDDVKFGMLRCGIPAQVPVPESIRYFFNVNGEIGRDVRQVMYQMKFEYQKRIRLKSE